MLECGDITKIYTTGSIQTEVLKHVSFTVETGEFVAIMGPSGSGKSTLMNILGCLDIPTSGSYFLDTHDVSKMNDNELAKVRNTKIGFVFQSFNLLRRANVIRNVALPLVYAGIKKGERIIQAQHALELSAFPKEFWYYLPNQLSGGMMQRVAIARALVNNPALILADEPTGNLDTKTGEAVLDTFQDLHEKYQRTIILITHELYVAEHAGRIITIRDGVLVDDSRVKNRRRVQNNTI